VTLRAYGLHVDGREYQVEGADLGESLLRVLRERLGVRAAKEGCASGDCGACSVLVDGTLLNSCLVLAGALTGRDVTTAAGLDAPDVQRAFAETGAVQCGFCTPGLVLAAQHLLAHTPAPEDAQIREGLSGNRCRCTGYGRVFEAVRRVAAERSV